MSDDMFHVAEMHVRKVQVKKLEKDKKVRAKGIALTSVPKEILENGKPPSDLSVVELNVLLKWVNELLPDQGKVDDKRRHLKKHLMMGKQLLFISHGQWRKK